MITALYSLLPGTFASAVSIQMLELTSSGRRLEFFSNFQTEIIKEAFTFLVEWKRDEDK